MTICCETLIMAETIAKSLLDIVDLIIKQHFFCTNGLRQLGWCAHYILDRRSLNYCGLRKSPRTTELTEFYWFNKSPNRSFKQKNIDSSLKFLIDSIVFFFLSENKNDLQ